MPQRALSQPEASLRGLLACVQRGRAPLSGGTLGGAVNRTNTSLAAAQAPPLPNRPAPTPVHAFAIGAACPRER